MNRIFQVGYAQFCSGHHWNISIFRRGPSTAKLHNQGTWTNKSQEAQTFASRKVPKKVWVVTLLLQNRTQRMYVHSISYHAPRCAKIQRLLTWPFWTCYFQQYIFRFLLGQGAASWQLPDFESSGAYECPGGGGGGGGWMVGIMVLCAWENSEPM